MTSSSNGPPTRISSIVDPGHFIPSRISNILCISIVWSVSTSSANLKTVDCSLTAEAEERVATISLTPK